METRSRPAPFIPEQTYFNIGEASRITQTPPHTLRYWESEFKLLRPVRRESGHRRYTRKDLELIFDIKELLHDRKMTLAGAKKALLERRKTGRGAPGTAEGGGREAFLREVRAEMRQIVDEFLR